MDPITKLSKKQKRLLRNQDPNKMAVIDKLNFKLKQIEPLTQNQKLVYKGLDKNMLLIGSAGTGKTFLSIYLSLKEIINNPNSPYKKLYICRSAEPTKSVGFLPGSLKEKMKIYESPYYAILTEIFERSDSYDYLKNKQIVEFMSTSYIRGITLDNSIVIVDEIQNLEWNELYAIMTRIGKNCKIIFCGDYKQSDLKTKYSTDNRKDDILKFIEIIKKMNSFKIVEFNHNDIVRSDIVKEFIIISESFNF